MEGGARCGGDCVFSGAGVDGGMLAEWFDSIPMDLFYISILKCISIL